jgi:hypothetical protein
VGTFQVGRATVKVWKRDGHWAVTVDDALVGGRHMTEAQAAGAGLLHLSRPGRATWVPARRAAVAAGARRKVA